MSAPPVTAATDRRRIGPWLALAALLAVAGCQRPPRPNIILYVVDTLRADALGCYGNRSVQTPALDGLARDGLRFTRAYANASWTRAAMGSLLTGQYPAVHGAVDRLGALRPQLPTLAARLRAAGYRTAAVIANPNIGSPFGFQEGFESFIELYRAHPGAVRPEELIATADTVVSRAIEWLRTGGPSPFFLLVFTVDPHAPYTPPPPYNTLYDPEYTGTVDGSLKSMFALAIPGGVPPEREIRHLRALYQGEVTFNDAHLARLLAELDRLNLAGSSLVVATSDHGEEFYEHGQRDHGHSLYEELIRVPLLMRWPHRIAPGSQFAGAVQLADLYPTLLGVAGAAAPPGPGRDLTDVLTGRRTDGVASMVYAEEELDRYRLRALVMGQRKLIEDGARPEPLAFDLAADPGELAPLTGPVPDDLKRRIDALRSTTGPESRVSATELPETVRNAMKALGYGDPAQQPATTPGQ